jgi:hypothetical protein
MRRSTERQRWQTCYNRKRVSIVTYYLESRQAISGEAAMFMA